MKKKLSLLMVAFLLIVGGVAYAAGQASIWKVTGETAVEAGSTYVDNDLMTVKTTYGTTLKFNAATYGEEEFTNAIQVRVDALPTTDNLIGTEKSGSTSLVITAKKDAVATFYYRRQAGNQEENDGKDVKIFDQADITTALTGTFELGESPADGYYNSKKAVALLAGHTYTVAAKGTTLLLYGIGVEAPAAADIEIAADAITDGDITAAIKAAAGGSAIKSLTLNLAAGNVYKVSAPIETTGSVIINGNGGAVIDASALAAPFIQMATLPTEGLNEAGAFEVAEISFKDVAIEDLAYQLFYANKQSYLIKKMSLDNAVIAIKGASNKTVFDFNGGGNVVELSINKSTIWADATSTWQNGGFFSTQSSKDAVSLGAESQKTSILNSTLYNIAKGKTTSSRRKNSQAWMVYEVKNNIIVDCGKNGQFLAGLNGGQSGKTQNWDVAKNSFTFEGKDVAADEAAKCKIEDANSVAGIASFVAPAEGDLTLIASTKQAKHEIGDPRWLVDYVAAPEDKEDIVMVFTKEDHQAVKGAVVDLSALINARAAIIEAQDKVVGKIFLDLSFNEKYTVDSSIQINDGLYIKGSNTVIDAANLNAPFAQMYSKPVIAKNAAGGLEVNSIIFEGVNIINLKNQLFYANKKDYLIGNLTVDNCIISIAGASNKTIFDFNGGGNVVNLTVNKSTIWADAATSWQNGGFFSTQSSKDAVSLGATSQTTSILNSTLYNIAKGKTTSSRRKNSQSWMLYEVKNSIIVDCGKDGQFLAGLNAGQGGKTQNWAVDGVSVHFNGKNVLADEEAKIKVSIANPMATHPFVDKNGTVFCDYAAGYFTVYQGAMQQKFKTGDPRWLTYYDETLAPAATVNAPNKDDATAIDAIEADGLNNAVIYNLNGQRVEKAEKGLYIINGKKVVIK